MVSGFSIISKSCAPVSWLKGVVITDAVWLCSRIKATAASIFSGSAISVRLNTIFPAYSI